MNYVIQNIIQIKIWIIILNDPYVFMEFVDHVAASAALNQLFLEKVNDIAIFMMITWQFFQLSFLHFIAFPLL